ncbi:hypothetical protein CHS0354_014951 [Potamilus streckersoni]|uniref:Uncharacterized protein n=1 Tax=Potamilus streckersoni TaxID=2493646 RepID=A0AAE0S8Q5_9BIVA|nr:hypothetical protein CHS0354_014951 [Potamilus streckersoni]
MVLQLYFDLLSQPSRAIYIFLKVNKIHFEAREVSLRKGEQYAEEFKKLNPFSKVPFIIDDGFILTESVAILRYLSLKYNVSEHWYPRSDVKAQARVDEYLNWQHLNIRYFEANIFREKLIVPRQEKKPINQTRIDQAKTMLSVNIGHLETYYLKGRPFLCGQDISVTDILAVCELMQLVAVHEEDVYQSNADVAAWIERVKSRLQPHFDSAHANLYAMRERFISAQSSPESKNVIRVQRFVIFC